MTETNQVFEIQRPQAGRYFYWSMVIALTLLGLLLWGVGVIGAIVYAFTFGPWLARKQAAVLDYQLRQTHLFVNQGVFFINRKSIPLDRITDIVLVQGPLLRHFGLWRLDIQTAGSGNQRAEARLYGLVDPEQVKQTILDVRDRMAAAAPRNPGF